MSGDGTGAYVGTSIESPNDVPLYPTINRATRFFKYAHE